VWIFTGTVFYALHDKFGWAKGLYMSVNVGWSIAWTVPGDPYPSAYTSEISKVFSIVHTSIGAIFIGVAVLFMARDLMENKDTWITMSKKKDDMENAAQGTEGCWDNIVAILHYYMSKLRVARFSIIWIIFGSLWYTYAAGFHSILMVFDFLASTLCAGGYLSLNEGASSIQYVVTALYATIGIPLIRISIGASRVESNSIGYPVSVYLSIFLSICLSVFLSIYLSVWFSLYI
jgi:hypothetical protein